MNMAKLPIRLKQSLLLAGMLCLQQAKAQPHTDVFLFDMTLEAGAVVLKNPRNISHTVGYDNQPSFYDEQTILFAGTRQGQTDIAAYDRATQTKTWWSHTPNGSEYSPLRIPGSEDVAAVRLDKDGLQRLYRYHPKDGTSIPILKNAKIGYHVWHGPNTLIYTVLVDGGMDLVVANLTTHQKDTLHRKVGSSLQKIPHSNQYSFFAYENTSVFLKTLDPIQRKTETLMALPNDAPAICWLPNGQFLVPVGNQLHQWDPKKKEAIKVIDLSKHLAIRSISRMAVSPNGTQLALVSTEPIENVVQQQVEAYNKGQLDVFLSCFSEDIMVQNFPADTLYVGQTAMRERYRGLSPENKNYQVTVVKRITIGNKVIDLERVEGGRGPKIQVAIYGVEENAIASMTFIQSDSLLTDAEKTVQEQLDAYNARDIDAFMDTYTEDVQLFNFPSALRTQGTADMRNGYARYFQSTPDLHCEIKNRMVIGNKVIDEEYITANGNNFSAVAIYEVENGKIAKVTFLR